MEAGAAPAAAPPAPDHRRLLPPEPFQGEHKVTQWHYVDGNRQRQGPIEEDTLIELWRSGRLGIDTLVWREGEDGWQPIERYRGELGVGPAGGSVPPPLPPAAPLVHATPGQGGPAPRSGLSGCMIALIVAAVLLVPGTAIVAAIALPAYQEYTLRARIVSVVSASAPLKARVVSYLAQHGRCPSNQDPGFGTPGSFAEGHVTSVTLGEFESNLCGMELMVGSTGNEELDGKALWLEYQPVDDSWQCSSEIDDRYLPQDCRG